MLSFENSEWLMRQVILHIRDVVKFVRESRSGAPSRPASKGANRAITPVPKLSKKFGKRQ